MIGIIDYGAGNLKSVEKAFQKLGHAVTVSADLPFLASCDKLILPGVGAFADAMRELTERKLDIFIREQTGAGKPLLGICLGMQLLFDYSEEGGAEGLGLLHGRIKKIPGGDGRKVPQIGWNNITITKPGNLMHGIADGSFVYFVHSYYLDAADKADVAATTQYGVTIDAACESGNLYATQFHPEKSSDTGLQMLHNFAART